MASHIADSVVHGRWVIPVEPHGVVLEHHGVVMRGGRIEAVLDSEVARARYVGLEHVECDRHALLPGLINAHTHAAMTLLRGLADDLPLMDWLGKHIWPAEQRWVNEAFVRDGTRHAVAEMIRGGTTCFNDMYFFPDVTAQVVRECGIRAMIGLIVVDFPSPWAANAEEYVRKGLALHEACRDAALFGTAWAPHAPYSVSNGSLARIRELAGRLDIPVHIHLHETRDEIARGLTEHGVRPLRRLQRLGLVSTTTVAAHMVHLEPAEIDDYAKAGGHLVHCPESNLKLASGLCPVQRLQQAGVSVALGTDGAASNNDLDMLGEMRTAALLAKAVARDASALPAEQVLRMATLEGARALGMAAEIGSLQVGKSADVVAVDLSGVSSQPIYHPISQLIYTATRESVSDVWVAGRRLLRERTLTTLDEEEIVRRSAHWARQILAGERVG